MLRSPLQSAFVKALQNPLDFYKVNSGGGSSPLVQRAKLAAAGAPTSVATIPKRAGPVPSLSGANSTPAYSYTRYWITGDGKNDGGGQTTNPRLPTIAYIHNFDNWSRVYGGGITCNVSDGSSSEYWYASKDYGSNPAMIGIRTNSRYISIPSTIWALMSLVIDGSVVIPGADNTEDTQYATWDLGSTALRNLIIVAEADSWIAEILLESGATVEPYDFTVTKPVTMSIMGDSYMGHHDIAGSGLTIADMMARQIGAFGLTATNRGGTGYRADGGGGVDWQGDSAIRSLRLTEALPDIVSFHLGINDPWPGAGPTTVQSMTTAIQGARNLCPGSILIVMGPWAPKESDFTNPAGAEIAKMNALITLMGTITGPWILLDNLRGNWITSKGTSRGVTRGPWQTGDGNLGAPTGIGNGDTWVNADGVHPSVPVGITGLSQIWAAEVRSALATL